MDTCDTDAIELHITVVEDDSFQQQAMFELITSVFRLLEPNVMPKITVTGSASGALALMKEAQPEQSRVAQLVLVDYLLPGDFNGDELLLPLRASIAKHSTVVMVSSPARETRLSQCLTHGADSYRFKPVSPSDIEDLIRYSLNKFHLFELRKNSRSSSPICAPFTIRVLDGIEHTLAHGRRSPTVRSLSNSSTRPHTCFHPPVSVARVTQYIAENSGRPVVIKAMLPDALRGPTPPDHPHINRVIDRIHEEAEGKWCVCLSARLPSAITMPSHPHQQSLIMHVYSLTTVANLVRIDLSRLHNMGMHTRTWHEHVPHPRVFMYRHPEPLRASALPSPWRAPWQVRGARAGGGRRVLRYPGRARGGLPAD